MSHGTGESQNAEPNLIPLLDVVFQLLMFFMMCVNFVTEQIKEEIMLPISETATPMDKADVDVLFINLKQFASNDFKDKVAPETMVRLQEKFKEGDPVVQVLGKDPMRILELKFWLKTQYEDAERAAKDGKVKTNIIIRADKMSNYSQVFQVLNLCKVQGYTQLKLRAYKIKSGATT